MGQKQEQQQRLYMPKGFTSNPKVKEILEPYFKEATGGEIRYFDGLPAGKAADLLKLMPTELVNDRQNDAPTFGRMIEVGLEFGQVWFHGYLVTEERDDERITLEGFYANKDIAEAVLAKCAEGNPEQASTRKPDQWDDVKFADLGEVKRAWWD